MLLVLAIWTGLGSLVLEQNDASVFSAVMAALRLLSLLSLWMLAERFLAWAKKRDEFY